MYIYLLYYYFFLICSQNKPNQKAKSYVQHGRFECQIFGRRERGGKDRQSERLRIRQSGMHVNTFVHALRHFFCDNQN